jgi:hypothetical protein
MIVRDRDVTIGEARERIARMVREHGDRTEGILRRHGAVIEAKAAEITPVDTGFLRRANTSKVEKDARSIRLTVENRMVYAHWQHEYPHRHTQPRARDHFIALPFGAELPNIVKDIINADMEALK